MSSNGCLLVQKSFIYLSFTYLCPTCSGSVHCSLRGNKMQTQLCLNEVMLNDNNMWICPENTELTYICTQLLLKCVCVYVGVVCLRSPPPLHMNRAEPCAVDSCLLWTVQRQKALNPVTSLFHVFIWYHSSSPYCRSIQLCSLGLQLATTLHSSPGVPHLVPLNEMKEGKKAFGKTVCSWVWLLYGTRMWDPLKLVFTVEGW